MTVAFVSTTTLCEPANYASLRSSQLVLFAAFMAAAKDAETGRIYYEDYVASMAQELV